MKTLFTLTALLLFTGCWERIDNDASTDSIRSVEMAAGDLKSGIAVIYYSGPHSGYDVPTPAGIPESDWELIKNLPHDFREKVMASGAFFKACQTNDAVITMKGTGF